MNIEIQLITITLAAISFVGYVHSGKTKRRRLAAWTLSACVLTLAFLPILQSSNPDTASAAVRFAASALVCGLLLAGVYRSSEK